MAISIQQPLDPDPLEADLLRLFRGFTTAIWALLLLGSLPTLLGRTPGAEPSTLTALAQSSLLLLLLWWPAPRRWLGAAFLPVILTWAVLGPMLAQWLATLLTLRAGGADTVADLNRLYFWLLLPLVVTSARYTFWIVLLLAVGTSLLTLLLALTYATPADWPLVVQHVVGRVIMLTLVGYLVERIARAQRTQRRELARQNQALAEHARTLEQLATSRERNRLARELHDTLAHTLTAIDVQLKVLEVQLSSDPAAARATVQQTQELTRGGLHEARRALQALRAQPLEQLGLALAVRQLAEQTASRAGLTLHLDAPEQIGGLRPEAEQQLYRIAEEALHNVVRHANAHNLSVTLQQQERQTLLRVTDDGRGMADFRADPTDRYGVRGLRERAALLGAELDVESAAGQGTSVTVTLPTMEAT